MMTWKASLEKPVQVAESTESESGQDRPEKPASAVSIIDPVDTMEAEKECQLCYGDDTPNIRMCFFIW